MSRRLPFLLLAPAAVFLGASVLHAASITVQNSSFQAQDFPTFPGYLGGTNPATITGWTATGGAGINGGDIGAGTPFADNGVVPDGSRVAFIQGAGSLAQTVSGLVPGQQYWLQAYVNSRGPGATDIPAASLAFGGNVLLPNQPVPAVGGTAAYYKVNAPFMASAASGEILISSAPFSGGDAALLVDGITLIQRDSSEIVIFNPSFEASSTGLAFPGYLSSIAGWDRTATGSGNTAINTAGGPFSNGFVPEGLNHAVLQNNSMLSQQLGGLAIGSTYRLTMDYYGRDGANAPTGLITIDGQTALNGLVPNTGGQLSLSYDFVAGSATPTLSIANQGVGPDTSLLFDNVSLRLIPEPSASLLSLLGTALLLNRRRR